MADNSSRQTFLAVVSDVLERFTFMFLEVPEQDARLQDMREECLHATITFTGKTEGAISVTAPAGMCREMAGNILGVDAEEAGEAGGEDALKELVNIVCGELLPRLYGDREVFDLSVPRLYRIDRSKWMELAADPETVRLLVDELPILANLVTVKDATIGRTE